MNMDAKETGCCPRFNPKPWEDKEIEFDKKLFAQADTFSLFHIPLNMGPVIQKTYARILAAKAAPTDHFLIMSRDPSPWKGEHYFAVTKNVPEVKMKKISGKFLTKVFEGPYEKAGQWVKEMEQYVAKQNKEMKDLYFFYTTCPGCAKKLGKNYVVAFAKI